jgi:long-subunit fatty acid transport protein
MKVSRILALLFIGGVHFSQAQILPSFGDSRTGGTGMQFLKIAADARSTSMGGAYVAVANDVASLYWNPAGITAVDTGKVNVQLSYARYFGDISANFAGAVMKAGKYSFVGLNVMAMNYGKMDETTEFDPKGTGRTFAPVNYSVGATYAKILTNSFSFGVTGKFAQEGYAGVNVNNVMFDLGLKYDVGVKHTRFGVSFSNFGFNVTPSGTVTVLKFNGQQTINSFGEVSVPAIFRMGIAFDPIHDEKHILTLSGQLNHPTDNNETYSVGAEYSYLRIGYLRTGYEFFSDESYIAPTFGAGIKIIRNFGGFTVDYGFIAKSRLGDLQRITFAITIR